jgi:hypothetical protein
MFICNASLLCGRLHSHLPAQSPPSALHRTDRTKSSAQHRLCVANDFVQVEDFVLAVRDHGTRLCRSCADGILADCFNFAGNIQMANIQHTSETKKGTPILNEPFQKLAKS